MAAEAPLLGQAFQPDELQILQCAISSALHEYVLKKHANNKTDIMQVLAPCNYIWTVCILQYMKDCVL